MLSLNHLDLHSYRLLSVYHHFRKARDLLNFLPHLLNILRFVSASELSLLAESGSYASFSITSDGAWTITGSAGWFNLSSKSGSGNATITITALSENASSEDRTAILTVQCGSESRTIVVSQRALYVSANVTFDVDDMVALTNSFAIPVTCSSEVMYYYARVANQGTYATKTDNEIVDLLVSAGDEYRCKPQDDDVWGVDGLSSNTTYTLYGVAFDKNGKRGPLVKKDIRTARVVNNRPCVYYSEYVSYTSSEWSWDTNIGAYADQFYMISASGSLAWNMYYLYSDAEIAYTIKSLIKSGSIRPIRQNSSWTLTRSSGDQYFYSAAWAQDADKNFAPEIDSFFGDLTSSSKSFTKSSFADEIRVHQFSLNDLKDRIIVFRKK